MAVKIDQDTCIGCGLCPSICPSVFEMDEKRFGIALLYSEYMMIKNKK